jgi:hypothetical protein
MQDLLLRRVQKLPYIRAARASSSSCIVGKPDMAECGTAVSKWDRWGSSKTAANLLPEIPRLIQARLQR